MKISVVVFEDDSVAYDILEKYAHHVHTYLSIHWKLSRTLVESIDPIDLQTSGWVPGAGRGQDTYAAFVETHELLASPSMPAFMIMVLDMEVITSEDMISKFAEIHKLHDVDHHLVGGLALAIQAIKNPAIKDLHIYLATRHSDTKTITSYLEKRIAKIGKAGRAFEITDNTGKFDTVKRAGKILGIPQEIIEQVLFQDQLDHFLTQMAGRTVNQNHDLIPISLPQQLKLLLSLLPMKQETAESFFHLERGNEHYPANHLVFEGLKEFGSGHSPMLSLFNVLCIALSVLIREHKKDVLADKEFIALRTWLAENHLVPTPHKGNDVSPPLQCFARNESILPMQSFETYKDSVKKLSTLFGTLFRNDKGGVVKCNLLSISVTCDKLIFCLNFPAKNLIRNLNMAMKPSDVYRMDGQGHNSTTAILRFLTKMQYSDQMNNGIAVPGTIKFGSVAQMNIEANGEIHTNLIFHV